MIKSSDSGLTQNQVLIPVSQNVASSLCLSQDQVFLSIGKFSSDGKRYCHTCKLRPYVNFLYPLTTNHHEFTPDSNMITAYA